MFLNPNAVTHLRGHCV